MKYKNISELHSAFVNNMVDVSSDEIVVEGNTYTFFDSSNVTVKSLTSKTSQPKVLLYTLAESDNRNALALVYQSTDSVGISPTNALFLNLKPFLSANTLSENDAPQRETVGDFVEVRFTNLPASTFLRGKVDTGATISCLHADSYSVDKHKKQVTFKCSHLSNNSLTLALSDMQSVKSASGTEYRPVVEMDVRIGEVTLSKMKFNLNDRSDMDEPVLIGQNVLEAGKFLIDPTVQESTVSWPDLNVFLMEASFTTDYGDSSELPEVKALAAKADKSDEAESSEVKMVSAKADKSNGEKDRQAELDDVYQLLRGSDIKFSDLIEYANTYNAD